MSRALRVGITGKFGSGKSTVSRVFREQGIKVIDSDQLAKDLMSTDVELKQLLTTILGEQTYSDGELNRAFVASKIFSDREARVNVESVVHPAVFRAIEAEFALAKAGDVVAVESALVFQTYLWRAFDYIVIVDATDAEVIERSNASGKISVESVKARLAEQDYRQDYVNGADFTISNHDSQDGLLSRALMIATMLKALVHQVLPDMPLRSKQEEEPEEEDDDESEDVVSDDEQIDENPATIH